MSAPHNSVADKTRRIKAYGHRQFFPDPFRRQSTTACAYRKSQWRAQNINYGLLVPIDRIPTMKRWITPVRRRTTNPPFRTAVICRRQNKIQPAGMRQKCIENPWKILAIGQNRHRQAKILTECRTQIKQSAASAAVRHKTGTFDHWTRFEARPAWGVPESVPVRAYQCPCRGVSKSRPFHPSGSGTQGK